MSFSPAPRTDCILCNEKNNVASVQWYKHELHHGCWHKMMTGKKPSKLERDLKNLMD